MGKMQHAQIQVEDLMRLRFSSSHCWPDFGGGLPACLPLLFPKKKSAENWAEARSKAHADRIGGKKSAPGEQGSPESGSRDMVVSPSPKDGEASTWMGQKINSKQQTSSPKIIMEMRSGNKMIVLASWFEH